MSRRERSGTYRFQAARQHHDHWLGSEHGKVDPDSSAPDGQWTATESSTVDGTCVCRLVHLEGQLAGTTREGRMNLHAGRRWEMDVRDGWQWDAIRTRRGGCGSTHRGGLARWDLGPGAVCLGGEVRPRTSGGFKGGAGERVEGPMADLGAHGGWFWCLLELLEGARARAEEQKSGKVSFRSTDRLSRDVAIRDEEGL